MYSNLLAYCESDIALLARSYPDRALLTVDWKDVARCLDIEVSERLLREPGKVLAEIAKAVVETDVFTVAAGLDKEEEDEEVCEVGMDIRVAVRGLPDDLKKKVCDIGSRDVGRLIAVDGRINRIGEKRSRLKRGAFQCARCGYVTIVDQPDGGDQVMEPLECESCERKTPMTLERSQCVLVDEQELVVQDLYENLAPGMPIREIKVVLQGRDLLDMIPAVGSQAVVTGIVRSVQLGPKSSKWKNVLEAVHIEAVEESLDTSLEPEDVERIKELACQPDILESLVASIAPAVLGYREVKLALLCAAVSGPNHLLPDGSEERGYLHVLLVGEPGTAKTRMARGLQRLSPRCQYAAGRGASGVGITAAVVRDELSGGWTVQAGALPLADRGLFILDELDKLSKEETQNLNTAMEESRFPIHKAGLSQEFVCRCPVVGVANPRYVRFEPGNPLSQVSVPPDTLSRFDLVFLIMDTPDERRDGEIARRIGQLHAGSDGVGEPEISGSDMVKYLAYARTLNPEIPDWLVDRVAEYYQEQRSMNSGGGEIPASPRDAGAIFRVMRSLAKLRLADMCSEDDFDWAKHIHSLAREAIRDPVSDRLDVDILHGMPRSQRDRYKVIIDAVRAIGNGDGGGGRAGLEEIVSAVQASHNGGLSREQIVADLRSMKKAGELMEPVDGVFQVV